MPADSQPFDLVAAVQSVKGGTGALALSGWGVWAGPQAKEFLPDFAPWASGVCLVAMVIGVVLLAIAVGKSIFGPPS